MAKKKSKQPAKAKKKTTKSNNKPSLSKRFIKFIFVVGIWCSIALFLVLAWYGKDLGRIAQAVNSDKKRIVRVYATDGTTELGAYGHLRGPNIRMEDLPVHIPNAFIAIEDRRFYSHFGIDLIGLARAMVTNFQAGGIVQGGSTITQQLAKNLFFTPERTLKRKIQEAMLALWIEYNYSKEEILSAYLNHVYFGSGAYGLDSATRIYFGKAPQDIGIKEAALLAGLMQAPSRLSPSHNPQGAIKRMKIVLNAMVNEGYATDEMIDDANNIVIVDGKIQGMDFADRRKYAQHFADWIYRQANIFAADIDGDLKITTTLSHNLQKSVSTILQEEINRVYPTDDNTDNEELKRPEGAAVLLNENGAIRAMVGGYDYKESQFNRATDSLRQAGSSFKPFVYLSAIEQGWRPDSVINNEKITTGEYRPSNYDKFYSEETSLREALLNSYNVASVNVIKETGVKHVVDLAERVGIDAEVREELSTALGTVDISLLDLTGAYATIGQDGRLITPYGIEKIETTNGDVLYEYKKTASAKVIAHNHVEAITSMMQDVVELGTGKRANPGFPVAGKTGTTQDYRDALFVGFSSTYTMGVWIGHDDNTSMGDGAYGGIVPASIFRRSLQLAHKHVPPAPISNYDAEKPEEFRSLINNIFSGGSGGFFGNSNSQPRKQFEFNE